MKTLVTTILFALPLALFAEETPMTAAAEKFLSSLDASQKTKAELPFQGDERENFHYTPRVRAGLPIKEMTPPQREAAMALLDAGMSEKGKLKIGHIMSLEGVLAELENNPKFRDPENYYVAVFGKPGDPAGWAWRFEGHHVSVNITLVEGKGISVTPSFLGSNPGEVRDGRHKGLRALAAEEDLARTLVGSLLAGEKKEVIFSEKPPAEIISGENRTATALDPVGILASDMTEAQRTALLALISEYTGRYRSEVAATDVEKMKAAGIDKIRFGGPAGPSPGKLIITASKGRRF